MIDQIYLTFTFQGNDRPHSNLAAKIMSDGLHGPDCLRILEPIALASLMLKVNGTHRALSANAQAPRAISSTACFLQHSLIYNMGGC